MMIATEIINVLIIDDEKRACTNLRNILRDYVDTEINIAGIAHNTYDAKELIEQTSPDAIFLDIEMPNENAFQFLERLGKINFEIIFVTAYDEYAIKAFKLHALDYILKPISVSELRMVVDRLSEKLTYNRLISETKKTIGDVAHSIKNKASIHKITLRDTNGVEIIDFKNIYFIEAQSSYSRIVFLKNNEIKEMIMSNPLSDYEEMLPTEMFFRIHRSYLANCHHLKKITNDGTPQIILNGNFTLPVSRRRYHLLLDFLKTHD